MEKYLRTLRVLAFYAVIAALGVGMFLLRVLFDRFGFNTVCGVGIVGFLLLALAVAYVADRDDL